MASNKTDQIDLKTFNELLSQYPQHIPAKLDTLEKFRAQGLPATLQQRVATKTSSNIYLTRDELSKLVEWKL
jgi:hypothetical protein